MLSPDLAPKTTWGAGDYAAMAERLQPAAAALMKVVEPKQGERVVDLACGTGNAALLAAARKATVVGVDWEPRLLEIAARRGEAGQLEVEWIEGNAAFPELPDEAFDVVMSVFGVMYCPDHEQATAAMLRLCRPGGIVALAAWAPNSFMPLMGRTLAPYLPIPPAGSLPPALWGDERHLQSLFEKHGIYTLNHVRRALQLEFLDDSEARSFLVATAGHVLAERPRLQVANQWNDLLADLGAFVRQSNRASGLGMQLGLDYLITIVQKPF
ncbi:MAG: class I SAM-dependent methyltransferase [Actinomycetota bacterium]